jgi:hypothetical protein
MELGKMAAPFQMAGGNSNAQFCGWKKSLGVPTTTAPAVNASQKNTWARTICAMIAPQKRRYLRSRSSKRFPTIKNNGASPSQVESGDVFELVVAGGGRDSSGIGIGDSRLR